MNETKNVFISHIHEDDSKLSDLKTLLKNSGITARDYSITSDEPNQAKSEEYIKSQILAPQINQCSVLVVYVSPETKNSNYVNWEIEYAHKQGKRIVGVWENGELGCELPEALEEYRDAMAGWLARQGKARQGKATALLKLFWGMIQFNKIRMAPPEVKEILHGTLVGNE
jgi:hypothetical protein